MDPHQVNPKNFKVSKIVYTAPNGGWSIAKGEWVEDEMERFAIRYNGDINDPNDKGFPSTFGNPMWFQLPYEIKDLIQVLIENSIELDI